MDDKGKDASVTNKPLGMTVAASPFNPVKMGIAIIIILAIPVYFLQERLLESVYTQISVLMLYSILSCAWIVVKVRKIVRLNRPEISGPGDQ